MAATMAFSTNAAGPSLQRRSKMDSIAQSEICVRSVLGAFLIRCVSRDVLTGVYLEVQSAPVGLRSESPDLVDLREIFCTGGEKHISRQSPLTPIRQRKSQARQSRRLPLRGGPCKRAASAGGSQRKGPVARQIGNGRAIQSQNSRLSVPIPVLRVGEFHGTHEIVFTGLPSMIDVKKSFALRDHCIVMSCCAACGKSSPPV